MRLAKPRGHFSASSLVVLQQSAPARLRLRSADCCQHVPLAWTECHFGGARPWFLCTEDAGDGRCCGRRVTKLYTGDSHLFACRQCRRLAYASQSENPRDRSIRRVRKIRMRLGAGPSIVDPFPGKPPRMHWRIYGRWLDRAE